MRIFICLLCLSLTLLSQDVYRFGVFPHMPAKKLFDVYSSVASDLEKEAGKPFVLMTKPYYKLYKNELDKGVYDIAFVQPFDYIDVRKKQGYIPIARRSEDLKAVLVVAKASKYRDIDSIRNKVVASAPSTAAVTRMMIKELRDTSGQGLDDFTISYSKNHFVCLNKIVNSEAVACITARRAVAYYNQVHKTDNFRIIHETQALPHALFVVHPRVSERVRELLQERIVRWHEDEQGRLILKKGNLLIFKKTDDREYDAVREFAKSVR
ncbi:phosphate/phosphite/phosphonate ABC transporter substrate-binding protein [Campylobacterota bacterium]